MGCNRTSSNASKSTGGKMRAPYLFISPKEYPGTTAAMQHFIATEMAEHSDEISPETVADRKAIILGAWHPIYYEACKKLKKKNVETWLYWTSSVGQTDFSNGGIEISYLYMIRDLVRSGMIDRLLCGNREVENMLKLMVDPEKVSLLPYCFDWDKIREHYNEDIFEGDRWVDLYCPSDVRKNILPQIHASKLADARVHFSGVKDKYLDFADLVGAKHTIMGWMDRNVYYRSVQTMNLGLQVTFAETFDYSAAEHFALARPCLYSPVIGQWIKNKTMRKYLMVPDCDSPLTIAKYMNRVLDMSKDDKQDLNKACEEFMHKEALKRNKNGRKILKGLLS